MGRTHKMAVELPGATNKSFKAAADLSTKQHFIVKQDGNGEIVLAADAADKLLGVLNEPGEADDDTVSVRLRNAQGTAKVIAGGTVTIGAYITTDSAGEAVATTTSTDQVLGIALEAAVDGDVFEFMPLFHILA